MSLLSTISGRQILLPLMTVILGCFLLFPGCGSDEDIEEQVTPSGNPPSVTTLEASDIAIGSAVLNASLASLGEAQTVDVTFELSTQPGLYMYQTPAQTVSETGALTCDINGLYAYQTYYYRVNATGDGQTLGEEKSFTTGPAMVIDPLKQYTATLKTNYGEIEIELLPEDAPIAVNNFVRLAREGYYRNVVVHRIVKDFMFQSGDPTGTGSGGPGYRFADEEVTRDYLPGTVAMANAGPNTNGSQFFICLADLRTRLAKDYTIFGTVTQGFEVAQVIGEIPVKAAPSGEVSSPTVEVFIEDIIISEK